MDITSPAPLETAPAPLEMRPRRGLSLFWRTFFFLALLLFGSIVAWLQTYRSLESEPRAIQSAQQLASLINLSRAALRYSDSIARVSLIKTLADEERVRITLREPKDKFELLENDKLIKSGKFAATRRWSQKAARLKRKKSAKKDLTPVVAAFQAGRGRFLAGSGW